MADLNFGSRVRALREASGITREGLAAAVGTSTSTIARIELNGHVPSVLVVHAIASHFGATVDELLRAAA